MIVRNLFSGAVLAVACAGSAQATAFTQTYYVSVSDFYGSGPVSSLSQQFTVTFEPLVSAQNLAVTDYSVSSALAAFAGPVSANTTYIPGVGTSLVIGGSLNGSGSITWGTDDFATLLSVEADGSLTRGFAPVVYYSMAGDNTLYQSRTATISTTPPGGAVPEPATWAMMLVGFGAMGHAMRRQQRQTVRLDFA